MLEVHVPRLEDREDEAPQAAVAPARSRRGRGRSVGRFLLEVVLIGTGVFLGLMGEQWREHARHRKLAEASLERFRAEILGNREALAAVTGYHATVKSELAAYFASERSKTAKPFDVHLSKGLGPVFFERTAWDLALATQSLAYVEPAVAFAVSHAYTVQQDYGRLQLAILQSTVYGRSPSQDFDGYWRSILAYYGDISIFDPTLMRAYDEALTQIDRTLRGSRAKAPSPD